MTEPEPHNPAPLQRASLRLPKRFVALTLLIALATACAALATLNWAFELFTHFTPYYALAAAACALALLLLNAWRWMALRRC